MRNTTKLALRVSVTYLVVGVLWILLSDVILSWLITDVHQYAQLQIVKGWFFVLLTGGMLYFFLKKWTAVFLRDVDKRRQAEETLAESEERYRKLVTLSPDAVYVHVDGRVTLANPAMCKLLGANDAAELLGKSVFEIIHPDYHGLVRDRWEKIHGGEVAQFIEEKFVRFDGAVIDVEVSAVAVGFQGRKEVQVLARDITERKRTEAAIRASEELFRLITENAVDLIAVLDLEGKRLYNSPSYRGFFGDTEALKGTDSFQDIHPDDRERIKTVFRDTVATGMGHRDEFRFVLKNGTVRHIESQGSVVRDNDGNPVRVVVVSRDVTERVKAEELLRRLSTALEQAGDSIVITDRNGVIEYVNPAFENTTGYSKGLIIGETPRILKSGKQSMEYYKTLWQTILGGRTFRDVVINKKRNGDLFYEEQTIAPIINAKGEVAHFVSTGRDITERKLLEQQLRQAQKLESLGTLAGGIAHDFNNILGIIMGHASLLSRQAMEPDRLRLSTEAITTASKRGAGLVRQLLTFARKTEPLLEPTSVNDIIREVTRLLQETFPRTITISQTLALGLPAVVADGNQLHQTILNLCVNARDAMPNGGRLDISTSTSAPEIVRRHFTEASAHEYVCIVISDTGTGMDEATRQHIFEPFFTTKGVGKGTGLGLAVVYGIVKSLNGHIGVESSPDKGCVFTMYLPIVGQDHSMKATVDEPAEIPGGSETILVVEDEEMLIDLIASLLEAKGYRVLRAKDGEEALDVYKEHIDAISLVLTDLGLPKLDGHDVFLKMKELNPDVKAIIASGYVGPEMRTAILASGVKDIITKPYVPAVIMRTVRATIDGRMH